MRRLILMRHAKSDWANEGQRDHDRPLGDRGRRDAPQIGAWLRDHGYLPQAALISTAERTRQTWTGLGPAFAAIPTRFRADLYHAAPDAHLRILREAPEVEAVLMLGHMPGIGDFARRLLAEAPEDPTFAQYPTTATSVIDLEIDAWPQAKTGAGRLRAFVTPKTLA